MVEKTPWSRNDKLVVIAIAIAVMALGSAFFIPEVRRFFGLEKTTDPAAGAVTRVETTPPLSAPQTAPVAPKPTPPRKPLTTKPMPSPKSEQHGASSGSVGNLDQSGNCNINQIGGSGNQASANCIPQLRISEQRVGQLATLLSAQHGTVSIDVRNADGITSRDADNLLTAFAKARTWNYIGVNRMIHGTDIGADNLPIPDPVGIHLYSRTQQTAVADFVKRSLKAVGVESHKEIDESVKDIDVKILVGALE
jgi:hypothetical protein